VIHYLNLYHPVTSALASAPTSSAPVNLPLVVGTANNLYKLLHDADGSTARINRIIIETWLEKIEQLAKKLGELAAKLGQNGVVSAQDQQAVSLRLEIADGNELPHKLADLFEQADKLLMQLKSLVGRRITEDKYNQFCQYFSEHLLNILCFTRQQNPELNARILQADV